MRQQLDEVDKKVVMHSKESGRAMGRRSLGGMLLCFVAVASTLSTASADWPGGFNLPRASQAEGSPSEQPTSHIHRLSLTVMPGVQEMQLTQAVSFYQLQTRRCRSASLPMQTAPVSLRFQVRMHLLVGGVRRSLCLQVGMASLLDPGSKIEVCKVDVTKRASCGDFLGNPLLCPISPGYRGQHPSAKGPHAMKGLGAGTEGLSMLQAW